MTEVNLDTLPSLELVDEDYADQLTRLKDAYQTATGVYPRSSYPETFLLEQIAYESALLRQLINREGRENLLAYAAAERLEHLGALLDVARLPAAPARCTLRFTLAPGHPGASIPAGALVRAADGQTLFATQTAVTVPAGEPSADVVAACTTAGTVGNGFEAGEITALVQTLPYVSAATNLGVSLGGAAAEDDTRLRNRIHLAPAKLSVAGSEQSYVYHTLSAHPSIADVRVWGLPEAPGEVHVCAVLSGGVVPDAPMRDLILAAISGARVRPITDYVIWEDPQPVSYAVTLQLQIHSTHAALAASAAAQAQTRLAALTAAWAERLGRDIVPEALVERCQGLAGVYRAVVASPTFTAVGRQQFPVCTSIAVTTSVVEEPA